MFAPVHSGLLSWPECFGAAGTIFVVVQHLQCWKLVGLLRLYLCIIASWMGLDIRKLSLAFGGKLAWNLFVLVDIDDFL